MAEYNPNNVALDWDDEIEDDGGGNFVILKEGDYNFTVTGFERGYYEGGAKVASCPKATVTVQVDTEEGPATARVVLLLNKTLEWKISSFFRCIGQKKHGQKLRPDWQAVIGSQGRGHFKPRDYTGSNGKSYQANDLESFYDYDEKFFEKTKPGAAFQELKDDDDELPF